MRAEGADVRFSALDPSAEELEKLGHFDATVIVIGERDVSRSGHRLFRRARADLRMRWASLLVVRWPKILPDPSGPPRLDGVIGALAAQAEPERKATAQVLSGKPFTVQLETLGPARLLRVLSVRRTALGLHWDNPRVTADITVAKGELWSARATTQDGKTLEGQAALAAILVLRSGSVRVAPSTIPEDGKPLGRMDKLLEQPTSNAPIPTSLFPRSPVEFAPPSTYPGAVVLAASTARGSSDAEAAKGRRADQRLRPWVGGARRFWGREVEPAQSVGFAFSSGRHRRRAELAVRGRRRGCGGARCIPRIARARRSDAGAGAGAYRGG